jgi:CubicO group peptidase (beta-lactamase class C family)
VVIACAPAARPVQPAPPPVAAQQRFADGDLGFRYEDPDRKAKLVAAAQKIDPAVAEEMASQHLPGLALGVVVDGELVYAKGYGVADVDAKSAPDLDTAYRIGSLTKSFTALSILSLRDRGVLSLDDELVKWVPEAAGIVYPTHETHPITLRQLLTHTSGLPREYDRDKTATEADITAQLQGLSLESSPGDHFSYSNLGFVLLSLTVAHASHQSFRDYVTKQLFEPLGMTESAFDTTPKLAPAYKDDNRTRELKTNEYRLGVGGGGIVSTVRDLTRYVAFQLAAYPPRDAPDTGPVRRATVRESHTTGYLYGGGIARHDGKLELNASAYGFGWIAERTCDGSDLVEHDGGIDSYRSSIVMLTHHGVGVIVLSNFANADPDKVANRVVAELRASGALAKPYAPHPSIAPGYDAAMQRFLVAYNAPTDASLRAMLAREPGPGELDELLGYQKLHGACSSFTVAKAKSPTDATFTLTCERGAFEVSAPLSNGKLGGFLGTSRGVDVPPAVRALATAAMSLLETWSDTVFAQTFDNQQGNAAVKAAATQLHDRLGACHIGELVQEAHGWGIELACEAGAAHFYLEEKHGKLGRFLVTNVDGGTACSP